MTRDANIWDSKGLQPAPQQRHSSLHAVLSGERLFLKRTELIPVLIADNKRE